MQRDPSQGPHIALKFRDPSADKRDVEVGQLDNAGTHLYLTLYWAQELAAQNDDADLKAKFAPVAQELEAKLDAILGELNEFKGKAIDLGGYYHADLAKVKAAMRPSATFNGVIDGM